VADEPAASPYMGGHPTTGEHPHLAADTIASELRHIAAWVPRVVGRLTARLAADVLT
jgi:hypothetical protein